MTFEHVLGARWFAALTAALALALALACGPAPTPTPTPTPTPAPVASAEPTAPQRPPPPVRKDGTIFAETEQMGTRFTINVWVGEGSPAQAGVAIEAAFAEIERIEQIMSEWRPSSELSQFNDDAGGPAKPLSPELFEVLQRSKVIAEATGGAFDPTFHAVGQLWHFEPGARPPAPELIAEKLALVGWQAIELDPNTGTGRLARPGMKIGLGAIAKGYGVDRASQILHQHGFADHIVEGGGDTYVSGTKGGASWKVGIQRPDRAGSLAAIPASDRAIVTSGGYQRFIEVDGKRYAHILDPRTGWPLDESASAQSVTLVAANATDADAYATAVAVMGPEQGMAFVEAHPALEAVLLTRSGELLVSRDLRPILVLPPAEPGRSPAPAEAP